MEVNLRENRWQVHGLFDYICIIWYLKTGKKTDVTKIMTVTKKTKKKKLLVNPHQLGQPTSPKSTGFVKALKRLSWDRRLVTSRRNKRSSLRVSSSSSSNRLASSSVSWCGGGGAATGSTSKRFITEDGRETVDRCAHIINFNCTRTGVTTNTQCFLKYLLNITNCNKKV